MFVFNKYTIYHGASVSKIQKEEEINSEKALNSFK
jgi:hypothetical protein